ncbi:6-deoxyerythronolide-B synthase EryA1, modules 1 and 2 [Favolaschia claudopus]|uniref:6-deoxyerythronolide-B synthase EryA1, modules 1 and 2 n=1 Tax=Favolaschia claudopus TaxID=2862362 RepID=A0AAW0C2B3_9AGAR
MSDCAATLLDVFRAYATDAATQQMHAVECGNEYWTYDDLNLISTGLAAELETRHGSSPTVAIIAENLPYTLALKLAVWKLGGIVAPIDHHTPPALMKYMLEKVSPSCVVVPSTEKGTQQAVLQSGLHLMGFTPEDTTMAALSQRFIDTLDDPYPTPDRKSTCIYLFTSSASDASNIKCVPLTHETLSAQAQALLQWNRKTFPDISFQHLRVLGWGPFSHMLAILDLSAHVILTGGCYIFGLPPSSYHHSDAAVNATTTTTIREASTAPDSMLHAMDKYRPDVMTAVPWTFEKVRETVEGEKDSARRTLWLEILRGFKMINLGGAPTSVECVAWVKKHGINLVLSIGMTEIGGALFHRVADESDEGWLVEDRICLDAELTLVDQDGRPHESEGELYVSSKLIPTGYLDHPSPSFEVAADGIVTFKTGDRYSKSGGRLKWLGRNEDYIILDSGELVDPRLLEKTLDSACSSIQRSCVVGNKFLHGSSQFLCVLIELATGIGYNDPTTKLDISRAVRSVNRELAPPLRINWARVLILGEGEKIPVTKKGLIWRKKLESLFGGRVAETSSSSTVSSDGSKTDHGPAVPAQMSAPQTQTQTAISGIVLSIVGDALRIPIKTLERFADSTFAELGMDSSAALAIVNQLNRHFHLDLPRNTCHTHVDLAALTAAISERLGHVQTRSPVNSLPSTVQGLHSADDVVIVGQAVRLPGDINTPEAFWEALVDMRQDLLIPVPPDRWDNASFMPKPGESYKPGDIIFEKAGFVESASFDHSFFGFSSAEALYIAPHARLILETTFQALEDANIPASRLKGSATGVFTAGAMDHGYTNILFAAAGFGAYSRFQGTGVANSAACGRLSYLLDINGPSTSIDTACSSGMVAFDQAVRYLQSGKAETAIVCGANTHSWRKMVSPHSRCATYSSEADGYVPAEGAVALILKTKNAALRDGDNILAIVKATDTVHNGRSQGLVAPSAAAQANLQRSLIANASLSPSEIDFVETHGTGTPLGDTIEIDGLNAVFRHSHTAERPLIIGTAKTLIGHTETIAGLVGIVKAIKQLSSGKVAGLSSLASGQLNPEIDPTLVPLLIPSNLVDVPINLAGTSQQHALVVAYGFAGTLAGTILQAPPPRNTVTQDNALSWMIFTVSAKSPSALDSYLRLYLDFCANAAPEDFERICYTSCVGRELYRYRFSCVARDLDDLVLRLKQRLASGQASPISASPRTIFAFPGQGSQFHGMAAQLSSRFPEFKRILTTAAEMASTLAGFDVLSLLVGDKKSSEEIHQSAVAQICIFVYQFSVCQFLRRLNVAPEAVMGNSLGEISAAVQAGVFTYELGLRFVIARARILAPLPDHPAGMASIAASSSVVSSYIQALHLEHRAVISVFSSPSSHVVSGDWEAITILVSHAKKLGVRATILNVDQGFHSHCIDARLPQLKTWLADHENELRPLDLPLFSTVLGKLVKHNESLDSGYWIDHARNPVQFEQVATQIKNDKTLQAACILDVGPAPTALAALQFNDLSQAVLLSSATKQGKDQELAFLTAIAALTEYGINPDFTHIFDPTTPKINIPTYPFQRQRHYPNFIPSRSNFGSSSPVPSNAPSSLVVDDQLYKTLNDHRINGDVVLPGAAMIDWFAKPVLNRTLTIRFHQPWVLRAPGQVGATELTESTFSMSDRDSGEKLCSGIFVPTRTAVPSITISKRGPASTVFTGDEVYHPFRSVQFGPLFRTITSIHLWDDHADGLVSVPPSSNPNHDRIRALDACLHMVGACRISSNLVSGAFLPMALEGFTLHADHFPSSFICRYRFPLVMERNNLVASTAFEVISHTGDLIASCTKYSVAKVEFGGPASPQLSFQQVWTPKNTVPSTGKGKRRILYFGRDNCNWIDLFPDVNKYVFGSPCSRWPTEDSFYTQMLDTMNSDSAIVLDMIGMDDSPDSPTFSVVWQSALRLMKALVRSKTRPFRFVVLSTTPNSRCTTEPVVLESMVQGMLRVFRMETGLSIACGMEFAADTHSDKIAQALETELNSNSIDNMVRYSALLSEPTASLSRFVPELQPLEVDGAMVQLQGVAVIVGMGSIGFELAFALLAAGCSAVAFIGRRPATDVKVAERLSILSRTSQSSCFSYVQADASDKDALRRVLVSIQEAHGEIKSIIHTAASIADATINSVTNEDFDRVLRSKVHAAHNLHCLTVELALQLESFVLLSSISVSLGNQGQVAYVAANAFLDALAAQRRGIGLPGVSLQLGPWESELVNNLQGRQDDFMQTISHKDGIPLILGAMSSPAAVNVIAALDFNALAEIPARATDSLFASLIGGAPQKPARGSADPSETIISVLRHVLELAETERLELDEPLSAWGVDSIAFGQLRGAVLKQLGVDLPLIYLSDAFSVNDMIENVRESMGVASD